MSLSLCRTIAVFTLATFLLPAGCKRTLMPTPNLYQRGSTAVFDQVAPEFQNNTVDVIYVTDRQPETHKGQLRYGHERSEVMEYGVTRVEIGADTSWDQLVEFSTTDKTWQRPSLKVTQTVKKGQFPATPLRRINVPDLEMPINDPEAIAEFEQAANDFRAFVTRCLAQTQKKEAYIFVHGFNNDFTDAAFIMANLWHFMGREGLPIIYTWPAGEGGLTGYFVDRESGEFTILHLKLFLKVLAETENVKGIHVLAHSRGTDVFITALRELHLLYACGVDPDRPDKPLETRKKMKLKNIILAAPDLDLEVIAQRAGVYGLAFIPEQFTIYTNKYDKALGMSSWLFDSVARLGNLEAEELDERQKQNTDLRSGFSMVDADLKAGFISHGYFHSNPAVSSDLILILRDGKKPGVQNGRPLKRGEYRSFWDIENDYPYADK